MLPIEKRVYTQSWEVPSHHDIYVQNKETSIVNYYLDLIFRYDQNLLILGAQGVGKSKIIKNEAKQLISSLEKTAFT